VKPGNCLAHDAQGQCTHENPQQNPTQLANAFDEIEFRLPSGDFYGRLEATEIADNAYLLACRHGCTIGCQSW